MPVKMWRNWKAHILLVGIQSGTDTLEKSFAVFQMLNRVILWPSKSIPRYIPKRNKNMVPHKNLQMNVHSIVIQAKSGGNKLPTKRRMNNKMEYICIIEQYLTIKRNK